MSEKRLDSLFEWLAGEGFMRSGELEGSGGSNVLLQFRRADCEVHALRERGDWFISLAPPGGDPSMGPYVWRHYLDGIDPDQYRRPETLEEQLEFVYERLDEVSSAICRDRGIGSSLRAINSVIISRRLGLDPDTLQPREPFEEEDKRYGSRRE